MNNTNNWTARQAYLRAKEIYFDAFINEFRKDGQAAAEERCKAYVDGLKLSQHDIRLEVGLNTTNTNFQFALTPSQVNSSNLNFLTENRLQMQDSLIATEMAIMIAQTSGQNDTTFIPATYPNTQRFAAADAAALNSTLYGNGSFRLICNNDVIIPYRGLWNFMYSPQTQQTAALGAGSPGDQVRGAEDGFVTLEPNILLIGSKGYTPEIQLKAALASAAANLRAICIFRGILAQNSTSVS